MPNPGLEIRVDSNIEAWNRAVPRRYKMAIPIAAARAVNKTMGKTQTQTRRAVSKTIGIPIRQAATGIKISGRAHRDKLQAKLRLKGGRPFNVIRFNSRGATQTAAGVLHGAWQPGARMKLATGAFLMPKSGGGRKPARTTPSRTSSSRKPRKRPTVKKVTATVATHFVAKRIPGTRRIKGVWGASPAQAFMWKKRLANVPGLIVPIKKFVRQEYPVQYRRELIKEVQRQAGVLTFQRGGGRPRSRKR